MKTNQENEETKKHELEGTVHIQSSFKNTIIVINDKDRNAVWWTSIPTRRYNNSNSNLMEEKLGETIRQANLGIKKAKAYVKGPGRGREYALKAIQKAGIEIISIIDKTPIPHNGCKPSIPHLGNEHLYISPKTLITLAILRSESLNGVTYQDLKNTKKKLEEKLNQITCIGYANINYPDEDYNCGPEFERRFNVDFKEYWEFSSHLKYDEEKRQTFIELTLNMLRLNLMRYGLNEEEALNLINSLTTKTIEDKPKKHIIEPVASSNNI